MRVLYSTYKPAKLSPTRHNAGYKVIHNPVHNLSRTFHIVRYPLKRGITFSKGKHRVRGENGVAGFLVRSGGIVTALPKGLQKTKD